MLQSIKKKMLNENEMYLGKKKVEISKITPAKWRQLFGLVDNLPGLLLQITAVPKSDFYMTVIQALDIALDEIVVVVSALTGIEKEYIDSNVGLDELVEFIAKTVKINRLDTIVKNVKSLFPKK